MSNERRLVDCKHLTPEFVAELDRQVTAMYEALYADHDWRGHISLNIYLEYSRIHGKIVPNTILTPTLKKVTKLDMGEVADGRLVARGTDVLSDYAQEVEERERVA